jgi:hypothetical protein
LIALEDIIWTPQWVSVICAILQVIAWSVHLKIPQFVSAATLAVSLSQVFANHAVFLVLHAALLNSYSAHHALLALHW